MNLPRTIFDSDHEMFRSSVRRFVDSELAPFHADWGQNLHLRFTDHRHRCIG